MIDKNSTNNSKAIAIIMVMLGHLISSNKTTFPSYFQEFATFSVGVFLFLSGYGLAKSFDKGGIRGFLVKRLNSVYIPFFIATLITSIYRGFYDDKLIEIIKTLTFTSKTLPIDPTMWFLYFICAWYAIFYFIFKAFNNKKIQITLLFLFSFALLHFPDRSYSYVLSSMFSLHAFTFPVGVLFARYINLNLAQTKFISVFLGFAFIILFYNISISSNTTLVSITSILFAISLPLILCVIKIDNIILRFFGGYSYEIYLFEGIFRWNNFSGNKISNAIIFFLTAISLAVLFKPIIDRVKLIPPKKNSARGVY